MTTIEAVAELRQEFGRKGWNKKTTGPIVLELLAHIALAAIGIFIFIAFHNLAARAAGALICTFGCMGVGTNTHTSSHYGTSERRWVNEALTYFGYPLFLGLSATYWWHKHIVLHHPAPNVVGVDTDSDLLPWFAMTMEEVRQSRGLQRFYFERLQFWVFPFAVALNCFNIQKAGWIHVVQTIGNPKERRASHFIDLGALILHYAIWVGLPLLFCPLPMVLGLYTLRTVLQGYAMYAILAPGHFPAEALRSTEEARKAIDFFTHQTTSTVSFRTGVLGKFLCSGLEYQIEHHLFPNISHTHYPQVSLAVQALCREQGLSYRSYSWGTALWKSWEVLRLPQRVIGQDEVNAPAN